MNPQYMPPSQFGAPPQGFAPGRQSPAAPDNFAINNSSAQQPSGLLPSQAPFDYKQQMGAQMQGPQVQQIAKRPVGSTGGKHQTNILQQAPGQPLMPTSEQNQNGILPGQMTALDNQGFSPQRQNIPPPIESMNLGAPPPPVLQICPPGPIDRQHIGLPGAVPPPNQLNNPSSNQPPPNHMISPLNVMPSQNNPPNQMAPLPNQMMPPPSSIPPQNNPPNQMMHPPGSMSSQNNLPNQIMPPPNQMMPPSGRISPKNNPPNQMMPPPGRISPKNNPLNQMMPPPGGMVSQNNPPNQMMPPPGGMASQNNPPNQMMSPPGRISPKNNLPNQMMPPPGGMASQNNPSNQMMPPPNQMMPTSGGMASQNNPSNQMVPPNVMPSQNQYNQSHSNQIEPQFSQNPNILSLKNQTMPLNVIKQGPTPVNQIGSPTSLRQNLMGNLDPIRNVLPTSNQLNTQNHGPISMPPLPNQMAPSNLINQVPTSINQMGPPASSMQISASQGPLNHVGPPQQLNLINPNQMGPSSMPMSHVGPPQQPNLMNSNQMGPPNQQYPPSNRNSNLPYKPNPPQTYSSGPANYPPNPNQLANQMNDMSLAQNRQFSGKPSMNGDNLPHMPPPLSQSRPTVPSMGGYPPMPQHQHQQMPGGPYSEEQQASRRLDPDQMPNPIIVTLDDRNARSGIFCTNQKGLVPPLVTTNFITQDQGNANPRFIRSTIYYVPTTSDMMKQTAVPFGLVISPLARLADQEYPPPIVDFGEFGPVRCIRCKAYMSPFMQFIDSGRRFQCLFCKATTEVPSEYFQHLDHTGHRLDIYERPELILGAYEFVATKDYCRNNVFPKAPAFIFVIDVSYNSVKSGLVRLLCLEMKNILQNLPIDVNQQKSNVKVGFITYNSTVHFYNIKGNLAQPQMLVVGDVQEMFMPLLDGFLCDVEESEAVIDSLMQQIPNMFAETRETETVLYSAIQAGLEALKASECAGKLLVFHSTLPTSAVPGQLKPRDDRKLLGTEKERTVLTPQTQAYNQLAQDCVAAGCSVDLFVCNNAYIDVATVGQISKLTGGEVFKYTYFQADVDGNRLIRDVITDISRPIAFDAIMRVRTSTGVRPTDFYGHFFMSNTTDMEMASIDCDKAVAIEIKHDDKLTEEDGVYVQVALLYTSCSGQRRLRILNLSLKTCSQMADLYRSCELDTMVNFFAKQCVYRLLESNPKAVKDALVNRCAQMLAFYRKNCANPSSAGQLILPECMKLLPLYVNCLLKSDAISGGSDMTLDERSFVMQCVTIMDIQSSVAYFYPRVIPLVQWKPTGKDPEDPPNFIRCTIEKMNESGVYLLENGIHMLMWIGQAAPADWIKDVFGVANVALIDTEKFDLPELDNDRSVAIRKLIDQIRVQRHRCMRLTLIRQRDKLETVFRHFLVEDRGQDGSSSYLDFLCHMHKEIRQLLS